MSRPIVKLSEIRDPVAGCIELPGTGERHDVRKCTGEQYQLLSTFGDDTPVIQLYQVVKAVVPTLTDAALMAFTREQCQAVILLASQGVAAVEAMFPPNAGSPEPPTPPG